MTLTEAHRLAQLRLGAVTTRRLMASFALLDPEDLDGTFADWLAVVEPVVQAGRSTSAQLAANYLEAFRESTLGAPFTPVLAGPIDPRTLVTSMLITGPVSIRANLGRNMPLATALERAQTYAAGAGMRHVLNAGRETITGTVKADPRARGYQRVTSGNACDFCTMLAGRGGVYGEASADFAAHDHCSCSAEPIYR